MAFDADAGAIAALKQATNMTSGLKPIEAETRDLFRRPLVAQELKRVDALVFDPPRQGAEAQARELAKSAVPIVVAVSCNPATFARDVRLLVDGGYRLRSVTPVDQFRHSAHVEIVANARRANQIGSASAIIDARCNSACSLRRRALPSPIRRAAPSFPPPCGIAHSAGPRTAAAHRSSAVPDARHSPSTSASSTASPAPEARCGVVACAASPIRIARPRCQGGGSRNFSSGR